MYSQIDSNKRKTIILIAIFIAVIMLAGYAFSAYSKSGYGGLVFAVIISIAMSLFGFYRGDRIALWTAGAQPISKEQNPYVYRLVENLCITAGVPTPKIYIMPDGAINAFATGRDPEHASIAITQGAIEKLENEELEGVLAHELSHIKNYDIRLMMIVIVLVGILALLSDWFIRVRFFGRGSGRNSNSKSSGQLGAILLVIGLVLLILSPIIGRLIQFAISRKREYLADASGALLTRYPEGLARALEKIKMENRPLDHANNATAHLYISNPFGSAKHLGATLFSTHPPLDDRIKQLRSMA